MSRTQLPKQIASGGINGSVRTEEEAELPSRRYRGNFIQRKGLSVAFLSTVHKSHLGQACRTDAVSRPQPAIVVGPGGKHNSLWG